MLNLQSLTTESLAKAAAAIATLRAGGIAKATVDLATGLTGVNLEAPAKLLVPLLSPFRQSIGRVTRPGQSTSWKRITAVKPTSGFFPAEGVAANSFSMTVDNPSCTYRTYGRGGSVTWEGQIGSGNFEDALARANALNLLLVLREEELVILGGNRTAMTPGAVTATAVAGGGMADDTWYFNVKALTVEAVARVGIVHRPIAGNVYDFGANSPTVEGAIGSSPTVGFSVAGTEANAATATTNNSVKLTWAAVPGAVAYAIYAGTATGNANLKFQGIVTQTEVVFSEDPSTDGHAANVAANDANTLAFDGIIAQLLATGSGAYKKLLNGPLSAAVGNQIPEIAAALQDIYDRTKVEIDRIVVGWPEAGLIDEKLSSVANDRINIMYTPGEGGVQFQKIKWYPSPISGKQIPVETNPNLPGGVILFLIDAVPYDNAGIPGAWQMHMGQDLMRLDYAMTAPATSFETRAFGALAGYATGLQGIIYDVHRF